MKMRWLCTALKLVSFTGFLFMLPGCWDYQSITTRAAMVALGIDPASDSEKLHITLQYPTFGGGNQSSGGGGGGSSGGTSPISDATNVSADGYTVAEAIKTIQQTMDRNVDGAQLQLIVFGHRLSRDQMASAMEELMRQPQMNKLAYVAAAKEDASDIIEAKLKRQSSGASLRRRFDAALMQHGFYIRRHLWEFWRDRAQYGTSAMIPHLEVAESEDGNGQMIVVSGVEVYPKFDAPFYLPKSATFRLNLLSGTVRYMNMDIPTDRGIISLVDLSDRSKLKCSVRGKQLWLGANVKVIGTLGRSGKARSKQLPSTDIIQLEDETATYLTEELTDTLQLLQAHGTDVLGFGKLYLQRHPEQEATVEHDWPELFKHAKLDVHVSMLITNRGNLV